MCTGEVGEQEESLRIVSGTESGLFLAPANLRGYFSYGNP